MTTKAGDFKGDTIDSLIDLVMRLPERETVRHALEYAYCDGKMAGIREVAKGMSPGLATSQAAVGAVEAAKGLERKIIPPTRSGMALVPPLADMEHAGISERTAGIDATPLGMMPDTEDGRG